MTRDRWVADLPGCRLGSRCLLPTARLLSACAGFRCGIGNFGRGGV